MLSTLFGHHKFDYNCPVLTEISSMGVMVPRLPRMRLSCGLSQRSWLISLAMQRSGFMVSIDSFPHALGFLQAQ